MENSELEKLSIECMVLFLRSPGTCFNIPELGKIIIADPAKIRIALKRLVSRMIIEEKQDKEAIVYRYKKPDLYTCSWGDIDDRETCYFKKFD